MRGGVMQLDGHSIEVSSMTVEVDLRAPPWTPTCATDEAARRAGVPLMTAYQWVRTGAIQPRGRPVRGRVARGRGARWTDRDVAALAVLRILRSRSAFPRRISDDRMQGVAVRAVQALEGDLAGCVLMVTDDSVLVLEDHLVGERVRELASPAVVLVDLDPLVRI